MTAMIDVVFLLLIFFVCTASFQAVEYVLPSSLLVSSNAAVDVPIEPPEELERIVVEVLAKEGGTHWTVNDQPCSSRLQLQELLAAIAGIDRSLPVVVDCDDSVPLGEAIAVYDLARAVGLEKVQFAAEAE